MDLQDIDKPWVVLPEVIPQSVCQYLREEANTLKLIPGTVGYEEREVKDYRNSLIAFFPENHWIMGILFHYAAIENISRWNYDIQGPSPAQFASYDEQCFYHWHADTSEVPINAQVTRKITCILNISENNSFEGGDFEIRLGTDSEDIKLFTINEACLEGTITIFPSVLSHRVTPVTSGVRKSITSWVLGPQLR